MTGKSFCIRRKGKSVESGKSDNLRTLSTSLISSSVKVFFVFDQSVAAAQAGVALWFSFQAEVASVMSPKTLLSWWSLVWPQAHSLMVAHTFEKNYSLFFPTNILRWRSTWKVQYISLELNEGLKKRRKVHPGLMAEKRVGRGPDWNLTLNLVYSDRERGLFIIWKCL